ncbi:hypothetical protein IWQ56_004368 [Coemansia nantahalensis]|uniref:Uncharacterized protein n=1 Tax=Coemansia helicoidea TaxID=1286919 RepID=A0ACC1L3Y2_9FUNG|nr:hypothetical protein IWQ56_004368 [Coemansia nantahalensis]KAJ2800689.1 hypothetical protein H4R21_003078 [Coemansia helicoidea]
MRCAAVLAHAALVALLVAAGAAAQTSTGRPSGSANASRSAAPDNPTSIGSPDEGCPAAGPQPITCDDGQDSVYIPETTRQCAHYACPPPKGSGAANGGGSGSAPKSVVLPAVLGSVIPALLIAAGAAFFVHRRRAKRRSLEAHHQDAKYMSSYNNLEENAFGGTMQPPGVFASQRAVSEWAEQDPQDHGDYTQSRASIPIIFSADFSARPSGENRDTQLFAGSDSPAFRETRLYNTAAPDEGAAHWGAPNVVNVAQTLQMPQIVHLASAATSRPATADAGAASAQDAAVENSTTGSLPLGNRGASGVSTVRTSVVSQMPRIIQISRPESGHSAGARSSQNGPASHETPLSAAQASWESDSEFDLDSDRDEGRGGNGDSDHDSDSSDDIGSDHGSANNDESDSDLDSGRNDDSDCDSPGVDAAQADPHPGLALPTSPLTSDTRLEFETPIDDSFSRDIFGSTGFFEDDDGSQARRP